MYQKFAIQRYVGSNFSCLRLVCRRCLWHDRSGGIWPECDRCLMFYSNSVCCLMLKQCVKLLHELDGDKKTCLPRFPYGAFKQLFDIIIIVDSYDNPVFCHVGIFWKIVWLLELGHYQEAFGFYEKFISRHLVKYDLSKYLLACSTSSTVLALVSTSTLMFSIQQLRGWPGSLLKLGCQFINLWIVCLLTTSL